MPDVLALQGSPRKGGNTDLLLDRAIHGAEEAGGEVKKVVLVDQKISPCLEIYACKKGGECAIRDDMTPLYDDLDRFHRVILASPIFFYNVSATAKAFIDRCQALWVRRYLLNVHRRHPIERRGAFIAVGATRGKRLFDGVRLTVRYFFDAIDMSYSDELLVRGVDVKGEILEHPESLAEAYEIGRRIARP
jgi:multimeric flavodoxin WrbA